MKTPTTARVAPSALPIALVRGAAPCGDERDVLGFARDFVSTRAVVSGSWVPLGAKCGQNRCAHAGRSVAYVGAR